jgi:hypothetical protein
VLLDERPKFVLKRQSAMVFLLVLNVFLHRRNLRFADRECGVPILPTKLPHPHFLFVRPFRRSRLDAIQQLLSCFKWNWNFRVLGLA